MRRDKRSKMVVSTSDTHGKKVSTDAPSTKSGEKADDVKNVKKSISSVEVTLEEAYQDLENTEFPFLGFIANPIRDLVLKPVLVAANHVLPPVVKAVPVIEGVVDTGLKVPFSAARKVYCATHSEHSTAKWKTYHAAMKGYEELAANKITDEILHKRSELHVFRGFLLSATIEYLSDPVSNVKEWTEYTYRLISYIQSAGIGKELEPILKSDRIVLNSRIMGHIQSMIDNVQLRRLRTIIPNATFNVEPHAVAKLMRYCCSAYGKEMMEGADIVAKRYDNETSARYQSLVGSEALKLQVCDHVGIPTSYITYFCMGHGGSMKLLRHYISVDKDLKAVVLVIRGTYSVSGWHVDFQGMSKEFCGGLAHAGISDMATAVAKNAKQHLLDALSNNPGYNLIITGQSLGGGVSPLVNLLCHLDPQLSLYDIRCHAFAGPPVFYMDPRNIRNNPALQRAIDRCVHYVHGDDVVPYLGAHTVRVHVAKLTAMDAVTGKTNPIDRQLVAMGRKTPSEAMVNACMNNASKVKPIPGALVLFSPAKCVLWFVEREVVVEDSNDPKKRKKQVDYAICDPLKFSNLSILLSPKGTSDHVPPKYEVVLNRAEKEGWKQVTGEDS